MITIGLRVDIPHREATLEVDSASTVASLRTAAEAGLGMALGDYCPILVTFGQDVCEAEDEDDLASLGAVNGSTVVYHAPASMKPSIQPKEQKGEKEDEKVDDEGIFKGFSHSNVFRKIADAKTTKKKALAFRYFDMNCEDIWSEASSDWCKVSAKTAASLLGRDTLSAEEDVIFKAMMTWGEVRAKKANKELKAMLGPLIPRIRWGFLCIATIAQGSSLVSPQQALDLFQFVSIHGARLEDGSVANLNELKLPESLTVFNSKRRKPINLPVAKQKYTLTFSAKYGSLNSANTFDSVQDQNFNTGCAVNTSGWFMAEFKTAVVVKSIRLGPLHQNTSAWSPTNGNGGIIQYSNDKSSWTQVGTVAHANNQWKDYPVQGKVKAKYWRVTHTSYLGTSAFEFS